jgi:hypothetical protein
MIPFEELHGRKCNTPMIWVNLTYIVVFGPEMLKEMKE